MDGGGGALQEEIAADDRAASVSQYDGSNLFVLSAEFPCVTATGDYNGGHLEVWRETPLSH
jgi:hypothetical protein